MVQLVKLKENEHGIYHVHYSTAGGNGGKTVVKGLCESGDFSDKTVKMNLNHLEYINFEALADYDYEIQEYALVNDGSQAKGEISKEIYEAVEPMYYHRFKMEESLLLESVYLTKCRKILTLVDRSLVDIKDYEAGSSALYAYAGKIAKVMDDAKKTIKSKTPYDASMKENSPHHVSTHLPGMRSGGRHEHMVFTHPLNEKAVHRILSFFHKRKVFGGYPDAYGKPPSKEVIGTLPKVNSKKLFETVLKNMNDLRQPQSEKEQEANKEFLEEDMGMQVE